MSPAPFFSVVICTFNRATLLPRALDSLRAQMETDWEAVVVDDGSTDDTTAVVTKFVRRDPRIRYLPREHGGLSRARNAGVDTAVGAWLTFLDSDDRYEPDHLAARRQVLEQHPDTDLLHGGVRVVGDPYVPDKDVPFRRIHVRNCVVGATFVMRPETLRGLGGFPDVAYAPDALFFERARNRGLRIRKVEAPTYVYDRTSPDSMCTKFGEDSP